MAEQEQLQKNASTSVADTQNSSEYLESRAFAPILKSHTGSSEESTPPNIQTKANSSPRIGHSFANLMIQAPAAPAIQPKLTIGEPGDKYEQEADRVAAQVVQQINSPAVSSKNQSVQRQQASEEEELQMKPMADVIQRVKTSEEEELQMKSAADSERKASADIESSINQARGGGQSLSDSIRQPMEQAFGADFSGVKVHTDSKSDELNQSIQAKAFTTGQDIFFRQGEYNPGSKGGQELLAHELTHVVQQSGSSIQCKEENLIQREEAEKKPQEEEEEEEEQEEEEEEFFQQDKAEKRRKIKALFPKDEEPEDIFGTAVASGLFSEEEIEENAEDSQFVKDVKKALDKETSFGNKKQGLSGSVSKGEYQYAGSDYKLGANVSEGSFNAGFGEDNELGINYKEKQFKGKFFGFDADLNLEKGEGKIKAGDLIKLPPDKTPGWPAKFDIDVPIPGIPGLTVFFGVGVKGGLSISGTLGAKREGDIDGRRPWTVKGQMKLDGKIAGDIHGGVKAGLPKIAALAAQVYADASLPLSLTLSPEGTLYYDSQAKQLVGDIILPVDLDAQLKAGLGAKLTAEFLLHECELYKWTFGEWTIGSLSYHKNLQWRNPGGFLGANGEGFDFRLGEKPQAQGIYLGKTEEAQASAEQARAAIKQGEEAKQQAESENEEADFQEEFFNEFGSMWYAAAEGDLEKESYKDDDKKTGGFLGFGAKSHNQRREENLVDAQKQRQKRVKTAQKDKVEKTQKAQKIKEKQTNKVEKLKIEASEEADKEEVKKNKLLLKLEADLESLKTQLTNAEKKELEADKDLLDKQTTLEPLETQLLELQSEVQQANKIMKIESNKTSFFSFSKHPDHKIAVKKKEELKTKLSIFEKTLKNPRKEKDKAQITHIKAKANKDKFTARIKNQELEIERTQLEIRVAQESRKASQAIKL